ncbi:MAG: DUF6702 family protein [Myxococcota bacterium]
MSSVMRVATLLLMAVSAVSVQAHEQRASVTRITLNERNGNLEVMHRFAIHDVEHAGGKLFGESLDVLGEASDRQRFENYVHGQFSLSDQDGNAIALTPVGNEVDGRYLWVYAETTMPSELTSLVVYHGALHEVWSGQSNLVNVAIGGEIKSATFVPGSGPTTIRLQSGEDRR